MLATMGMICAGIASQPVHAAAGDKPNIVVIWGDDIGRSNLSTYTEGMMGYQTPNIDRIAAEGMKFTDYYAEQSCTAGRSSRVRASSARATARWACPAPRRG
jgi:arylsulfatase